MKYVVLPIYDTDTVGGEPRGYSGFRVLRNGTLDRMALTQVCRNEAVAHNAMKSFARSLELMNAPQDGN
jgi:hypothetical protein